ncbi:ribosomal protein L21-like protein [Neurospora intermedia]|uniref:Large ribosomal subunit protein bL21m n=1 Tax=Neurospora intermedia TaxID=5142 RepID=A0ABR3DQG1_NEUIN
MSRALLRSVLELRTPVTRLPPSFLLPFHPAAAAAAPAARFLHQTAQQVEPTSQSDAAAAAAAAAATLLKASPSKVTTATTPEASAAVPTSTPFSQQPPISQQVKELLPVLAAQPGHYTTIHIHGKPYLVTEGDTVKLPFKMPGVAPGDVLRLNRASVIGSRDLTLQGAPYVDERLFECRAIVMGTESEPMRVMIKKKRRCRKKKHVFSKHKYTVLRINQLKINDVSSL